MSWSSLIATEGVGDQLIMTYPPWLILFNALGLFIVLSLVDTATSRHKTVHIVFSNHLVSTNVRVCAGVCGHAYEN